MSERLSKIWAAAISAWCTLRPKHPPRYRREAHYMRGPGPAWRAKHAAVSGQHMLEQTIHLPVAALYAPGSSPLAILEELCGRRLLPAH